MCVCVCTGQVNSLFSRLCVINYMFKLLTVIWLILFCTDAFQNAEDVFGTWMKCDSFINFWALTNCVRWGSMGDEDVCTAVFYFFIAPAV